MGSGNAATDVPVVERGCAPVYFVKGFADIIDLGNGNILFSFFRPDTFGKEVEVKLICHTSDALVMMQQVDAKLAAIAERRPARVIMM